jgi:GNAT superfamily N-acetyltransferase
MINYVIERLDKRHYKQAFSCGIEVLDRYLIAQASQDIKRNVAATYVIVEEDQQEVLGFYTLSSIGIFPGDLPEYLVKKLPRYPILPGVLLGRLAVDRRAQRQKIGARLLVDALQRSVSISHQIGVVAVIVDAKDGSTVNFYEHFGFIRFLAHDKRMFLPINTIKKLEIGK